MKVGDAPPSSALRLVHYWWPVVMAWSLAVVAQRATGRAISSSGLCALLLGTLAAYSLDRLLDGSAATQPAWLRATLVGAVAGAGLGALMVLPLLPPTKIAFLIALSLLSLAYRRLKRISMVKTILVPAVWTCAAIVLPTGWPGLRAPFAAPLFLLVAGGCLLCDVKDVEADARSGVRSLPVLLGVAPTLGLAAGLAAAGAGLSWLDHRPGLLIGGLGLVALAPWRTLLDAEAIGPLAVDLLLTLPGLLVAAHAL